jgi:hypothetical protein
MLAHPKPRLSERLLEVPRISYMHRTISTITSIIAALCLVLLSACATTRNSSSNLTIISARYGVADRRVDVADAVRSVVTHDQVRLRAPWALGLVDPAFGTVKDVQIVYRFSRVQRTATFTQEQDIVLPNTK